MHHHAIAAAVLVVGDDRHQQGFVAGLLAGGAIHQQRVVAHHADLDLVGHHAVGDGWSGSEVLPVDLEFDVLVLPGLGKVFLEQAKFLDDDAPGYGVRRGVLGADTDDDFLLCTRATGRQHQHREAQQHGCRPHDPRPA